VCGQECPHYKKETSPGSSIACRKGSPTPGRDEGLVAGQGGLRDTSQGNEVVLILGKNSLRLWLDLEVSHSAGGWEKRGASLSRVKKR